MNKMSVTLTKSVNSGQAIYYNRSFRQVVEDHLSLMRDANNHTVVDVTPSDAEAFNGDLYGLLAKEGVSLDLHWCIMRLNDYTSPTEMTSDVMELKTPNPSFIDRLVKQFRTNQSISTTSKK